MAWVMKKWKTPDEEQGGGAQDMQSRPGSSTYGTDTSSKSQLDMDVMRMLNLHNETNGLWALFRVNPVTKIGKRIQLLRMLSITMVPIFILLSLVGTIFCMRLNEWMKATEVRQTLRFSIEISELVDNLQKERDYSAIYVSSIGMATKAYLVERYPLTDASIQSLTGWDSSDSDLDFFQSKDQFQNYLNRHRYELDSNYPTQKKELEFYSELIGIFMQWFYDTMTEASSGTVWKQLVSLQETMEAKEMFGIERAFGSIYYIQGGFKDRGDYLIFAESQDVANATLKAAREYSSDVEGVYQETVTKEQERVFEEVISQNRYEIRNHPFPENMTGSLQSAKYWSDNMTLYVDAILDIQRVLTERIYNDLLETEQGDMLILTVLGVVVAFTVAMCPVILNAVYSLTLEIQSFSTSLVDRSKVLNQERDRTDTLQYQMLPRSLAEQIRRGEVVQAEPFPEATIFYSDMVDFTSISARSSPTQVINMLDNLYYCFDTRLQQYDVYKVETMGVSYMVVSGLPEKNGRRHSAEIGKMSLDLLDQIHHLEVPHMPGTKIKLRIGIHTGPICAGIVGAKMPRYCLFGETVEKAFATERTGLPGRIHISSYTHQALNEMGGFIMTPRTNGPDSTKEVMGPTFWLLHCEGLHRVGPQWESTGNISSESESDSSIHTWGEEGEEGIVPNHEHDSRGGKYPKTCPDHNFA